MPGSRRVAVVTGAGSGLGRVIARALLADGWTVALAGRRSAALAATADGHLGALAVPTDVTDLDSVETLFRRVVDARGRVDLLVNNAGLGMRSVNPRFMVEPQPFWQVPADGFRAVIDTNLTGYFLVAREVVPRMLGAGGGRVVNISVNQSTMTRQGFVPYGPSRAGAEALSRVMAADLAGTSVTVNILMPGGVTETGMLPPEHRPEGLRPIDPAVMGPPIVWLATPAADGVHDERIVATEFESWLAQRAGC
jgi:gluconate 5-dehydrogenase